MDAVRILLLDISRVSLDTTIDMREYPLGLVYVATALKKAYGGKAEILIESYEDKRDTPNTAACLFDRFKPDILGLRSLTMGRKPLHEIATLAKECFHIALVIVGGPHATDAPEDVLKNPAVDCAVLGEGEDTAVELVASFLAGKSLETVRGIAVAGPNGITYTAPRPVAENLDLLPLPDHHLLDFQRINRGRVDFSFRLNVPHANLFSSRGCPYQCLYCHHVFGKRFRAHSAERLMDEVKTLHDDYGITRFQIIDDIFNLKRERAMRFFELVVRSGLKLTFSFPNGLRGDRVDREMVDAMWQAGVRYIAYAIETASPRLQKLIGKHLDLERLQETISLSTAKGIVTRGFFMIGFPAETEDEAQMTVEYCKASDLVLSMFFTVVYFPGTPLYRLAREISNIEDFDLGLEDDYVRTREGPYAFSKARLADIKLKAIREFFFSDKRLRLSFEKMPNFYTQRDIDASMLVNIVSGKVTEGDIHDRQLAKKLHRYFLIADRFSEKEGFFV